MGGRYAVVGLLQVRGRRGVGDFPAAQHVVNLGLERCQARARKRGCVLGNGRLCRAECKADELLQMLALQVAAQAGDFCCAAVQFRPDRVVQPVEQIRHREWCFIRREA